MAGSAAIALGMRLLSLMGVGSSTRQDAACMLVLGNGHRRVMQVLVIIVQNGVPHSELGRQPLVQHRLRSVYDRSLAGKSPLNHHQLVISVDVGERV